MDWSLCYPKVVDLTFHSKFDVCGLREDEAKLNTFKRLTFTANRKPRIFQGNFHTFSIAKLLIHASILM